jgi:peptidyl-prolyl cis-trans isomerase SurA
MNESIGMKFKSVFSTGLVVLAFLSVQPGGAQSLKPKVSSQTGVGLNLLNSSVVSVADSTDQLQALDYMVAVVDNEPITNIEVNTLAAMADPAAARLGKSALLQDALETLINESAQLQVARQQNMQISADELQQAIDMTARRNNLSLQELQQRVQDQGLGWERYRAQIKRQLLLQRVREREINARIKVQDYEIEKFLNENSSTQNGKNDNIHIAHILLSVPEKANADEVTLIFNKALDLLQRVKKGEDFGKLAAQYSNAPDRTNGGQLGMRSPDRYPVLFVDAVQTLSVGAVAGPIRSGAGFHLLKLLERKSPNALPSSLTQTRARHILLRPGGQLSQDAARAQLAGYKSQIEAGSARFEDLAKQFSQDASATQGGDLGWANPGMMVPEFEKAMDSLQPGQIGDPLVSRFGVHLLQVLERREAPLSLRDKQELARNILRERKFEETLKNWEREVRGRAYVEYREPPQ